MKRPSHRHYLDQAIKHARYLQRFRSVHEVWNIEAHNVVSSQYVWITSDDKVPPALKHFAFILINFVYPRMKYTTFMIIPRTSALLRRLSQRKISE